MAGKRIMAILLGGILVLNSGTSVLAAEMTEDFTDALEEEQTEEETGEVTEETTEEENVSEEITQGDILIGIGEEKIIEEGDITDETERTPSLDDIRQELINELEQNENCMSLEEQPELLEMEEVQADTVVDGQALVVSSGTTALTADAIVPSVTTTGGTLDLAGYTLTVTGDVIQQGGTVNINRGSLYVGGNFTQKEGYNSLLKMQYTNDKVTVEGNYATASKSSSSTWLKAGTLTIGGDLTVGAGNNYNFLSTGDHNVVFKGQKTHLVSFLYANGTGNNIANLKVESGQIAVNDYLSVNQLDSDLNIVVMNGSQLYTDKMYLNGHTVTVNGNLVQTGDVIDLEGGNLTVNGDVTQQSGRININRGAMAVKGNFEQKEGYDSLLKMQYTNDNVTVEGNYTTASTSNSGTWLKAGTLTIGGDLMVGAGNDYNFLSSADHNVVFKGQKTHLISFSYANGTGGNIGNLKVESGQIAVNDYLSVNKLENDLNIVSIGGTQLYTDKLYLNGHTVMVNGNLTQIGDVIDLEGGNLTVNGDVAQQSGNININKGTMTVKGNFEQKEGYSSLLKMQYTNDKVTVEGNYTTASKSNSNGWLKAGLLTIGGDFTEGAGNSYNFCANGTHQVKLNGDGIQRVSFANYPSSHFNRLHVSKPIATGYTFSPYPCWNKVSGYIYTYAGFDDVPSVDGNWKHDNIKYVYEQGVMNGISGTNDFKPDDKLTRAMFATVLYRMAGEPDVTFSNKFTDVKSGQYYSKAVIWAYNEGIVSGFSDGSFGVNNNITREQIAKMLYEFGKSQGYDMSLASSLNDFTDTSEVSGWATGYMQWAVGAGMISGKPNENGTFRLDPKGDATRAECAKMLSMFMQKYAE